MAEHTRAPWKYDRATDQVDCDGGTICHGIGWAPNGPLIAAAPDLLDAAETALGWLREAYGHASAPYNESAHRCMNDLVAAIAKAEGKP